jgi:putative spermidine/putrescine transport system permease protein
MILPVYAGLERLPNSMPDAAGDLGAHSFRTFRTVVWPVVIMVIYLIAVRRTGALENL